MASWTRGLWSVISMHWWINGWCFKCCWNVEQSSLPYWSTVMSCVASSTLDVNLSLDCRIGRITSRSPIQSNISMHHYRCVALYEASILQKGWFWAASLASSSSMSNEVRSSLMFLSQLECGCPGGLLQSSGGAQTIFGSHPPPHPYELYVQTMKDVFAWRWRKVEVVQSCDRYHHFWRSRAIEC